jgi:heme-degrading monooxygenase HmoA
MVVEIAILKARPGDEERLREGLRAARSVIARARGYRDSVFYQGIEDPRTVILRIEWDSIADHTEGFRQGPLFSEWRSHFASYMDGAPQVAHYEVIAGS